MDLAALKTELDTDPETLGYAAADDVQAANLLNTYSESRKLNRRGIPVAEIVQQIELTEFEALTAARRQWLELALSGDTLDVDTAAGNTAARDGILVLFPGGSGTRTRLIALLDRGSTRAEFLFGAGVAVTPSQVADARRLP